MPWALKSAPEEREEPTIDGLKSGYNIFPKKCFLVNMDTHAT